MSTNVTVDLEYADKLAGYALRTARGRDGVEVATALVIAGTFGLVAGGQNKEDYIASCARFYDLVVGTLPPNLGDTVQ